MRYLKTINELRKETYLSAANKLLKNHPLRAKKLIDKADEVDDIQYLHPYAFIIDDKRYYITEVTSVNFQEDEEDEEELYRLENEVDEDDDLYGFLGVDDDEEGDEEGDGGGLDEDELDESVNGGIKKFIVTLQSVNDKKQMKTPIGDESIEIWDFEDFDYDEESDEFDEDFDTKKFKFSNRKDARMFISIIETETGDKVPFTTNDIYTSK